MDKLDTRAAYVEAKALLAGARSVLVSGHLSPDGDSLGSMIALARMLSAAGWQAVATADVKALGKPGFLEGVSDLVPLRKLKRRKFDLFIYVDASSPERLPPEVRPYAERLPVLVVDHHLTNSDFGTVSIVDPAASSSGSAYLFCSVPGMASGTAPTSAGTTAPTGASTTTSPQSESRNPLIPSDSAKEREAAKGRAWNSGLIW